MLFYVAGYDTTANLINYFLYEMAINQPIQEKLQQELDRMSDDAEDLYEAVQSLEYLDMCVSGKLVINRCSRSYTSFREAALTVLLA